MINLLLLCTCVNESVKTRGVFRYLKQGVTVVYPSVDAVRVTAFAVNELGQSKRCCFSNFFSAAEPFGFKKRRFWLMAVNV